MSTPLSSRSVTREAIDWRALEEICAIRETTSADAIDGAMPERVAAPESTEQLAAVLRWANDRGVKVVPRGGGTKLGWANVPRALDLMLSLERFQAVRDHAWQDMTATVEAGVSMASLQRELAEHGQRLPLDALWPERSTVGGVVSANDSGALRLRFGSVRDLILGATVVLADGTIARSGGRVVKNVAGYDLPKLFTGSMGTLGVITEVTLRTYPLPHAAKTISFRFDDAREANKFVLAVADTTLVPAAMQMRVEKDASICVDLCFEGVDLGIAAQVERATEFAASTKGIGAPENVWAMRESLWEGEAEAIVGKFSVLPTAIADAVDAMRAKFDGVRIIVQSLGIGLFRAEAASVEALQQLFTALRSELCANGGSLTLLQAPLAMKKSLDVFGATTSAQPLIARVKQQFDPNGTLSPGRFVGGI
jgi:glycolate oxidase FAD binding subunit